MQIEELLEDSVKTKKLSRRLIFFITFTVLLIYVVFHMSGLISIFHRITNVLSPFLTGIVLAFILNLLVKLFETKVFSGLNRKGRPLWLKCRRAVSILISLVLVLAFLAFVLFLIIPEIANSLRSLVSSAPTYIRAAQEWIMDTVTTWDLSKEQINSIQSYLNGIDWMSILGKFSDFTSNFVGSVLNITVNVTSGIINFVMSIIFAIYLLAGKEKILHNIKRVLFAFLPSRHAERCIQVGALSNRIFAGFVSGQCTEALIIGCLCYLGMTILKMPYALLISTVIAVTSVIPIFGAYIGAIFGALILLFIRPITCLWFLIFIIALQNFEGNVIYPRVVGNSVGLPGIWVMLAIFVCGDLFGFVGMLIGVPTFSVLYALLKMFTAKRLKAKDIDDAQILSVQTFPDVLGKRPPKTIVIKEKKKGVPPKR